jgi:hypothetical protein
MRRWAKDGEALCVAAVDARAEHAGFAEGEGDEAVLGRALGSIGRCGLIRRRGLEPAPVEARAVEERVEVEGLARHHDGLGRGVGDGALRGGEAGLAEAVGLRVEAVDRRVGLDVAPEVGGGGHPGDEEAPDAAPLVLRTAPGCASGMSRCHFGMLGVWLEERCAMYASPASWSSSRAASHSPAPSASRMSIVTDSMSASRHPPFLETAPVNHQPPPLGMTRLA